MKDFFKKNAILILAFSLPVLVLGGFALSTIIPSLFLTTDYDFVYTTCDRQKYYPYLCDQYLDQRYQVVNRKIVRSSVDLPPNLKTDVTMKALREYNDRIFYHDTKKNESHEISFEDAQKLVLNNLSTSPDGVSVSGQYSRNGGDFFPFGGHSSSYGYYLIKGNAQKKLQLINTSDQYYYQNNFQFLGWVKGEKR